MLKKFLKEVVIIVVGKQAEDISDVLDSKKHVNEFLIAKKLGITINQTRNILYKISDYGLVSSIRKKDKRKGWYTYFWKIEILKTLEFLNGILLKRIEQLNNQIKNREARQFYVCERCNIEFNEENALLHNFTCDECGGLFALKDNTKVLRELKRQVEKLRREMALVEREIEKEEEKINKQKTKELKKQKIEKEKTRKSKLSKTRALKEAKRKLKKKIKKPMKKKKFKKTVKKKLKPKKIIKKKIKKPVKKKLIKKKLVKKKAAKKIKKSVKKHKRR